MLPELMAASDFTGHAIDVMARETTNISSSFCLRLAQVFLGLSVASAFPSANPACQLTETGDIWQPPAGTTWQIILNKPPSLSSSATSVTPDVGVFDIDLFDTSKTVIDTLHNLNKKVICYFSAGSYEPNRPDSAQFKDSDKGNKLDGWEEWWIDTDSENVRNIMTSRIQLAAKKGCDAVDPDNTDAYDNDNGLGLTEDTAVDYMNFLANIAQNEGMAIGLKNSGAIIDRVLDFVQFSVNEQCVQYRECGDFSPFIDAGKPVFHIEYPSGAPAHVTSSQLKKACSTTGAGSGASGFSTVIKDMDLDGWVEYCDGKSYTTPT